MIRASQHTMCNIKASHGNWTEIEVLFCVIWDTSFQGNGNKTRGWTESVKSTKIYELEMV